MHGAVARADLQAPRGTRDFYPEDARRREWLFAAYEWGLFASQSGSPRNAAEVVGTIVLRPAGELQPVLRLAVLIALAVVALVHLGRREVSIGRGLLLRTLEGLGAAILLGPVLIAWVDLVEGPTLELGSGALATSGPTLERAARLVGGAAWEEGPRR